MARTPAEILRGEILNNGPVSFERFMEVALYHPGSGYYRRRRSPFGRDGDFYTATQLQPVFGDLIRAIAERLTDDRTFVDWGAGADGMREAFASWNYRAIEHGDAAPEEIDGVIFANELFDALPCRVFGNDGESLVDLRDGEFVWTSMPVREECPRAFVELNRMAASLRRGFVIAIDYGYEERERASRFPSGSLMSYRKHFSSEDVLSMPGERDITFHVNFSALIDGAETAGLRVAKKEKLAAFLLRAGEEAIGRASERDAGKLKSLLFSMGEKFDALLLEKIAGSPETLNENDARKTKGPGEPGPSWIS